MLIVRRILLVVMVLVLPALLTWLSYFAVTLLLVETHRYISPQILKIAGIAEFAAFFFITALDARARWTVRPSE